MLIQAFNDIPRKPLPEREGVGGLSDLRKVAAFEIGTGNRAVKADQSGLWLGAHKFADAPFRVGMNGAVVANSFSTNDYVPVGGSLADIGAGNITGTYIGDGEIVTAKLAANAVTATKINVSTLSAISANIGTITVTITGALFRTAASGQRIEIDDALFGATAAIEFIHSGGQSQVLYASGANEMTLATYSGGDFKVFSNIKPAGHIYFLNSKRIRFKDTGGNVQGSDIFYDSNMDLQIKNYDDGSHIYLFTTGAGRVKINGVTKTAIMKTLKGYRELYCIESPEVWFMDFCESKDKIDSLFLEVTEGEKKFIKVEGGGYQVWRRRKGFGELRFEEKTEKEYHKNNLFWAGQR
jgi:hypothetical protein